MAAPAKAKVDPNAPITFLTPSQLIAQARKKYGDGIIISGKQLKNRKLLRATTGSLGFDYVLGGGWVLNQWCEVIGKESSAKTALLLKTIAVNQALNKKYYALWIASEPFNVAYAESYGVDMDRIHIVETNVLEEAYDIVTEWQRNRACDAIVIDSYPAMTSNAEDEAGFDNKTPAINARLNGVFFRKSTAAGRRHLHKPDRDCLLLMVNQWRMQIGVLMGDPRITPGGLAKNYHFAARVETKREKYIDIDGRRVGIKMFMQTIKNKTAPVGRTAVVDLYFEETGTGFHAGDFDLAGDAFNTGRYMEIIHKGKPMFSYLDRGWKSAAECTASLREEPLLMASLRADVLKFSGVPLSQVPAALPVSGISAPKRMIKRPVK